MMNPENFSTYKMVSEFNRSDFRRKAIPQNLFSGWPCIHTVGKTLCLTIPYYARTVANERVALYPIFCSVTIPVNNPDRIMDFTIYAHQRLWSDIDFSKPVGYFKHEALSDVKTKGEYNTLVEALFGYYDKMILAVLSRKPFEEEEQMTELFTKLMEPGQYPQYLRLNKKFYSHFCRL